MIVHRDFFRREIETLQESMAIIVLKDLCVDGFELTEIRACDHAERFLWPLKESGVHILPTWVRF